MKKVLLIYLVLIAAIAVWWFVAEKKWSNDDDKGPKEKALTVSKHGDDFNESIEKLMESYYSTTESFVKGDTISIDQNANRMKTALDDLKLEELKKDTTGIYETAISFQDNTKGSLQQMIDDVGLEAKRKSFKDFSDNLYTLINTVHYDHGVLYWMECATAFGEGAPGYWLSDKERSANPYGQKDCGTIKKSINVPKK